MGDLILRGFFDANDDRVFIAFSPSHVTALSIFVFSVLLLYGLRRWFAEGKRSRNGRYALAAVLLLSELTLNLWYVAEGIYSVKETLPLELCSISLYLCVVMLLVKSRLLFQIAYFTGIAGAIQALLTPVLGYAFPHFRFIQFFVAHMAIILSVLYMAWVEGYRPTLKSIALTMGFLNVLLVLVSIVNSATGGNYMFLARKPDTASLLDFLGPHPWYLLSMEGVALLLFVLLYVPFTFSPPDQRPNTKA